ncbi:hypothetical protein Bbelb_034710 [Branchiostoma belcheri]|nr:hypothetical protein Bbelb_034710 [Branchiostoma belcheri]
MEPVVPLPLDPSALDSLAVSAKDYAILRGLAYLTVDREDVPDLVSFAPFTLLPSPVPRALFDQARAVQQDFNLLVHRVSHDREFLTRCLSSVVKVDNFTAGLFNIYEQVMEEGVTQPICLGLHRSDYLLDTTGTNNNAVLGAESRQLQLKQTEINTIAAAGAGFSEKIASLHKLVLNLLGVVDASKHIPENRALESNVDGFVAAWELYGSHKAIIVFVIEEERTKNVYEQRLSEFAVMERHPGITAKRYNMRQIAEHAELTPDKTLFMSRAIKCPCISYHLAGTKKVQQELAQPGVLEKFLDDPMAVSRGLEGDRTVQMAIKSPEDYVMKPQREGGGHNTYGEDIRTILRKLKDSEERAAYIIMDLIRPAVVQNYFIKPGDRPNLLGTCCELGILGVFMA